MATIRSEDAEYKSNVGFWTNKLDGISVIGDFARIKVIELLNPKEGEKVLDAGCGAGWVSRRLAKLGAWVIGCDREVAMIAKAREEEKKNKLGLLYNQCDIAKMPYPNAEFGSVLCVAVLMHDSPEQVRQFVKEAYRVLRPGGRLLVSLTHPEVYKTGSPSRTGEASWLQLKQLEEAPYTESHRYEETYKNDKGESFVSTVWYHPEDLFRKAFPEAGINPVHEQSIFVTQEMLNGCKQSGGVGHPGFYQILGIKS